MLAPRAAGLRERREPLEAARGRQQARGRPLPQPGVHAAVAEGDEVAAVIEVQVAQHDRVERAGIDLLQGGEGAAAAVEQDARAARLDEVGRARLARVRPGRAAADDGQGESGVGHPGIFSGQPNVT